MFGRVTLDCNGNDTDKLHGVKKSVGIRFRFDRVVDVDIVSCLIVSLCFLIVETFFVNGSRLLVDDAVVVEDEAS